MLNRLRGVMISILTLAVSSLLPVAACIAQSDQNEIDRILEICTPAGGEQIPSLHWVERSDWINVKVDVQPAAKGDGRTDDTEAIQVALDLIGERPGDPKVVYFPPGSYRISNTLRIVGRNGGMLIGHGRESVLQWSGAADGRMFWSNGAARQVFLGLVWDGAGKAGVGIDHDSKTLYETRVIHKHMEFRNFRQAGIRVGHDQKLASAEMMFHNMLFQNNRNGVLVLSWNDYNNIFDGVHFIDNGTGIRAEKGNVVVRNARFERSREADLLLSTHSHSVRRVVSRESHKFIETTAGPALMGAVTVQECLVMGWHNPDGAIISSLRGPLTVFDCEFSQPPNENPPIRLAHPRSTIQTAILSNNTSLKTRTIIAPGVTGKVEEIEGNHLETPTISPQVKFLRSAVEIPNQVLDVKQDCGARGNGSSNDTAAIQSCIARASREANGILVYFPSGRYLVSSTINVDGANYWIGGSGFHSQIVWGGPPRGEVLRIANAHKVGIEYLAVGGPEGVTRIHHTGNATSAVRYDTVYGWTEKESVPNAFRFDALGAGSIVVASHIDGTQVFGQMTASKVLIGTSISTQMTVEGTHSFGSSLGVLSRVSCCADYPLIVRDNQSIILSDWYNEQSLHLAKISGVPNAPFGRVTIDSKKAESESPIVLEMSQYRGRVTLSGGFLGKINDRASRRFHFADSPESKLTIFGSMFRYAVPEFKGIRTDQHNLQGNIVESSADPSATVPDRQSQNSHLEIKQALDDFRELGRLDLLVNYCVSKSR